MKLEFISQEELSTLLNSLQNKSEVMGYDLNGNFILFKKCLVLFDRNDERFSYDPLEVFIPVREYYILKNYVMQTGSHYIPESGVHLFFSMKDFWDTMIDALKNKLF